MNSLLKQRLVGTLVLVALGVVFWPLIFVTHENREPLVLQPMSQRPVIDQTPISEPESYESSVAPTLPAAPENPKVVQDAADASTQTNAEEVARSSDSKELPATTLTSRRSILLMDSA